MLQTVHFEVLHHGVDDVVLMQRRGSPGVAPTFSQNTWQQVPPAGHVSGGAPVLGRAPRSSMPSLVAGECGAVAVH